MMKASLQIHFKPEFHILLCDQPSTLFSKYRVEGIPGDTLPQHYMSVSQKMLLKFIGWLSASPGDTDFDRFQADPGGLKMTHIGMGLLQQTC